ncbi:MAG: hypothetical protein QN165_04260, partial [Armatimonadota bacterium]|nr:hypothetical protein [Armatimonadota bacterium]
MRRSYRRARRARVARFVLQPKPRQGSERAGAWTLGILTALRRMLALRRRGLRWRELLQLASPGRCLARFAPGPA